MAARLYLPVMLWQLLGICTAQADCTLLPGPGDDNFVCSSASAPSLTDTSGDNSLLFPAGGNGSIIGNVTFGAGRDRLDMASGRIAGNVNQGAGIDDFSMSGGVIEGNLNQGDGLDTFYMYGGWIQGTFDSGDYAEMDGGRIGNVNMRLDQNTFIMRGGGIDQNLITGFDTDYVEVFNGSIGGNISVSGGNDQVLVHGGQIGGSVLLSTGDDRFVWDGGRIGGSVDLGPGNDTADVRGLGADVLANTLDGGSGEDSLTFAGSNPVGGANYSNWEQIHLTQASRLALDDTLLLGDAVSGSGTLTIDPSSTLTSRQGTVAALGAGGATVRNAGTLDLSAGNDARGRLTIVGDYQGSNGSVRLNSVLAGDGAASDRLIVSQGTVSGSTRLHITNLGGSGAATVSDGILVVEAVQGATSSAAAFTQAAPVSAGAYDYQLFKGGLSAGSENNWYLRSSLLATQAPLYRPEVPVYAAAPRGAAVIARLAVGTLHQRQGDQRVQSGSWGQAYAANLHQQWSGTVNPSLQGDINGFRVGQDLYTNTDAEGAHQQAGVYLGHSRLNARVEGYALAQANQRVGELELTGDSLGLYWTRVGARGGYVDGVVQYTWLDGQARSDRGGKLDLDGHAWTASLEAGLPMALWPGWTLEPQAQLVAQKVVLDDGSDRVSHVAHEAQVEITTRLGLRLERATTARWQPYAQLNVWHGDGGHDSVVFDQAERIKTDYRYTSLQVESGLLVQASETLTLHAGAQYTRNLDSRQQQASGVNLGLRWRF